MSNRLLFFSVSLLNGEKKVLNNILMEKKLYKNQVTLPHIEKNSLRAKV
jgi:hypothetical protein